MQSVKSIRAERLNAREHFHQKKLDTEGMKHSLMVAETNQRADPFDMHRMATPHFAISTRCGVEHYSLSRHLFWSFYLAR
jgi:hypothetical protein